MKKFYEPEDKKLVFVGKKSSQEFWDEHWEIDDFKKAIQTENRWTLKETRKYLKPSAKILEGGCGRGSIVYTLDKHGFDVYGVDFAENTVNMINKSAPELKVTLGNVENLKFEDKYFDGYWSLGVIEHFYQGYEKVAKEMHRVLKPGGYLFMTVPSSTSIKK